MVHLRQSAIARAAWGFALALGAGGMVWPCRATGPAATATGHTQKVLGTPHFYQCDSRGRFAGGGKEYCAPTAVSDSLMYLASHGFPKLRANGYADPADAQIAMIDILAVCCMETDPASGTGVGKACDGIEQYVEGSGYVCKQIEYRGWRQFAKSEACYSTGTLPTLAWIEKAANDPHGAAWVNIGWYVHGDTSGEWKRVGGHWLAVVGSGVDEDGHTDPSALLVDNPAVPWGASGPNDKHAMRARLADGTELPTNDEIGADVMKTAVMGQGRLVGSERGLPRDAAGMYAVWGSGVAMSTRYDAAFIDGAIVLVIGESR